MGIAGNPSQLWRDDMNNYSLKRDDIVRLTAAAQAELPDGIAPKNALFRVGFAGGLVAELYSTFTAPAQNYGLFNQTKLILVKASA